MDNLTNLKSSELSNLDENIIQSMILPKNSAMVPSVISTKAEDVAVDSDEPKKVDQFHGEVLEKPWKLTSCGNKSSQNGSIEQEVSICKTSDIMANPEDDENNPDYTRSSDRIINSSSTNSRRDMTEHLLFDILLLLPITTLLRFKSICKSWYALISSSIFIAQHFEHNCSKDNLLCFLNPSDKDYNIFGYKLCSLSGNKYEVNNNFDGRQFGDSAEISFFFLALSSNGIICLVHSGHQEVILMNPTTKQLRPLPKSSISYKSDSDSVFFGFGYNVQSNDYKVVTIIGRKGYVNTNVVFVVEVYSLRADSWRTILKDVVLPFRFLVGRSISKNGICFWIASDYRHDAYTDDALVSFNLNDETFGTMPLPRDVRFFATLDFFDDKLAYICGLEDYGEYSGPIYYEIWLLHEYGVKESWSKVWKIGPTIIPFSDDVYFPFGFTKNGDHLLLTDCYDLQRGTLYLYCLGTEENEYVKLRQLNEETYLFVRYEESLVSV